MGFPALPSATAELVVLNLIPQHDPQADPELAAGCYGRFSQSPFVPACGPRTAGMSIPTEHWANVQPTVATLLCLTPNNKVVGSLTVWHSFKRLASCGMHALMLQRSNEGLLAALGVSGSE